MQHLRNQLDGVDLLNARELQHIVAHNSVEILSAPALGLLRRVGQAGLRKAAAFQQMRERNIGWCTGLFAPLPYRKGVQAQAKKAPGQRLATLP